MNQFDKTAESLNDLLQNRKKDSNFVYPIEILKQIQVNNI
jgi:hypothetical protein